VITGSSLTPNITLLARVGAKWSATRLDAGSGGGVVRACLGTDVGRHANVVVGISFAPDIAWA